MTVNRRRFVAALSALVVPRLARAGYPAVRPGRLLTFPRDHGAHPDFRTEWWYVTGWVRDAQGSEYGVQITFFRNRPRVQEDNPSRFAPRQLLFAHAALADVRHGRLRYDQRAAREGNGIAEAAQGDARVRIEDWSLTRNEERYAASVASREFAFELEFRPTQPVLLQGERGFSRKGPRALDASYYYSMPQLAVAGQITARDARRAVTGAAWLDHEWSSHYLADAARGWDWVGVNLEQGAALMAFRMRGKDGGVLWASATYRDRAGHIHGFRPGEIAFEPLRHWRSARTETSYPVAMRVRAGELTFDLEPLMDDQELDARASVGTVYWEGAVRAVRGGRRVGAGYMELTGYWRPLKL
jgi:predicted secreted hydrolase